jgi:hypothetical protein
LKNITDENVKAAANAVIWQLLTQFDTETSNNVTYGQQKWEEFLKGLKSVDRYDKTVESYLSVPVVC